MTHTNTTTIPPKMSVKEAIATGRLSKNAQVSGYPGHPNPTVAALVSDGVLNLSATVGSLTFVGYGGE